MTHRKHNPRKRFGQHFLCDQQIIEDIINVIAPQKNDLMFEIGPGLGALTQHLLPCLNQLHAVEIDRDIIPQLEKSCGHLGDLIIHQADILKFDFSPYSAERKLRIIGNLPYNISTPIIFHLLKSISSIIDIHIMLQLEVAKRLVAPVGGKDYSRLSVMTQYFCDISLLLTVPAEAFDPPPQVNSAIVRLKPREEVSESATDIECLGKVVTTAFNQRRKTLGNALKTLFTAQQMLDLEIDPQLRPERISVKEYVKLSNFLYNSKTR